MPPFRYLGNILGCAGVRFGLGSVCVPAWARAWEGEDCARALALTGAGLVSEDGRCPFWKMLVLEAARFRASTSIDSRRSVPMRFPARVLASEMFVWHAART